MISIMLRWGAAALIMVLGIFISAAALAVADHLPSPWASAKVELAETAGLTAEDFSGRPYTENITRKDFCELLINSCRIFEYPLPEVQSHPFSDTHDRIVGQAFMLGLTSGTAKGIFSPDMPLTREMAVVMLGKLRILLHPEQQLIDGPQAQKILQEYTKDGNILSDWAAIHMADAYFRGIITGTGTGILSPKDHVTREQAVILTLNTLAHCDQSRLNAAGIRGCVLPAPSGIYISPYYQHGEVNLTWGEVAAASAYEVRVFKDGVLAYATRTKKNNLDLRTGSRQENDPAQPEDIFGNDRKTIRAAIEVIPLDEGNNLSLFSLRREFIVLPSDSLRHMETIPSRSKTLFKSEVEALSFMKTITVQVWQLSSGVKTTAAITLTVHRDAAEDVRKIFAEIYNGKEKFPIKSCYGYSYRGASSQHSSGLAIDINPDENYFISRDGVIKTGKLWKPGENPYSILPDGDVVRAFHKYGWHWSPEMHWSSGADYMHFSLAGT